jgi:hypothetical protein
VPPQPVEKIVTVLSEANEINYSRFYVAYFAPKKYTEHGFKVDYDLERRYYPIIKMTSSSCKDRRRFRVAVAADPTEWLGL